MYHVGGGGGCIMQVDEEGVCTSCRWSRRVYHVGGGGGCIM